MSGADSIDLPPWAVASEKRRAHIARVTALLTSWARAMGLSATESAAWRDAGRWHDALRDAPENDLRPLVEASDTPAQLLHGPATAARLAREGETREDVLDAIRWHTTGRVGWARTGRALYMADFLEPGRTFDVERRASVAARVPQEFDAAFRSVVQQRIEWTMREGRALHEETARLWNAVR